MDREGYVPARRPGFVEFHLLRGPVHDDHVLYLPAHDLGTPREDLEAGRDPRRSGPRITGRGGAAILGHPEFEGFEVPTDDQAGGGG